MTSGQNTGLHFKVPVILYKIPYYRLSGIPDSNNLYNSISHMGQQLKQDQRPISAHSLK